MCYVFMRKEKTLGCYKCILPFLYSNVAYIWILRQFSLLTVEDNRFTAKSNLPHG